MLRHLKEACKVTVIGVLVLAYLVIDMFIIGLLGVNSHGNETEDKIIQKLSQQMD